MSGRDKNGNFKCSICLKSTKKVFECDFDETGYNCIGGLCKTCYDTHMKHHEREEGWLALQLRNWLGGQVIKCKGNHTFL